MQLSATSSVGLPLHPSQCRKRDGRGQAASGNARPPSSPQRGFGEPPPPLRTLIPTSLASGHDPQEEGAVAASAPIGGRSTSPGAAVAAARPAGASPGAIGYRFSCLSLGAPGERGLHRPAGAPVSISPLSPHQRGSLGATRPSWAEGRRSTDHLQGQPRGKRDAGVRLPPKNLPGVARRPPA